MRLFRRATKPDAAPVIASSPFPLAPADCIDRCDAYAETCESYPSSVASKIDHELTLYDSTKPFSVWFIVATGQQDWVHTIESEEGSCAHALAASLQRPHVSKFLESLEQQYPGGSRVVVSNSNVRPSRRAQQRGEEQSGVAGTDIWVLPFWLRFHGVTPESVDTMVDFVVDEVVQRAQEATFATVALEIKNNIAVQRLPFDSIVLLCSHKTRDKRCQVTAPYLQRALAECLELKGVFSEQPYGMDEPGGVAVAYISHIGGHKFAGNVIVNRSPYLSEAPSAPVPWAKGAGESIWLGRVEPKHIPLIVDETVVGGRAIPTLLRGGRPGRGLAW